MKWKVQSVCKVCALLHWATSSQSFAILGRAPDFSVPSRTNQSLECNHWFGGKLLFWALQPYFRWLLLKFMPLIPDLWGVHPPKRQAVVSIVPIWSKHLSASLRWRQWPGTGLHAYFKCGTHGEQKRTAIVHVTSEESQEKPGWVFWFIAGELEH